MLEKNYKFQKSLYLYIEKKDDTKIIESKVHFKGKNKPEIVCTTPDLLAVATHLLRNMRTPGYSAFNQSIFISAKMLFY